MSSTSHTVYEVRHYPYGDAEDAEDGGAGRSLGYFTSRRVAGKFCRELNRTQGFSLADLRVVPHRVRATSLATRTTRGPRDLAPRLRALLAAGHDLRAVYVRGRLGYTHDSTTCAACPRFVGTCRTCGSKGFAASVLGPDRCGFCDGTAGGNPPEPPEVER